MAPGNAVSPLTAALTASDYAVETRVCELQLTSLDTKLNLKHNQKS